MCFENLFIFPDDGSTLCRYRRGKKDLLNAANDQLELEPALVLPTAMRRKKKPACIIKPATKTAPNRDALTEDRREPMKHIASSI